MKTNKKIEYLKDCHTIVCEFVWTVSHGADTYGYNICSLYANGDKVSSTNGGGYDMQGVALQSFLDKLGIETVNGMVGLNYVIDKDNESGKLKIKPIYLPRKREMMLLITDINFN